MHSSAVSSGRDTSCSLVLTFCSTTARRLPEYCLWVCSTVAVPAILLSSSAVSILLGAYAIKTLAVSQAADRLPMLIDPEHGDFLAADDMPVRQVKEPEAAVRAGQLLVAAPSFEQVPLGPIRISEGQFEDQALEAFIRALEAAGYEMQRSGEYTATE